MNVEWYVTFPETAMMLKAYPEHEDNTSVNLLSVPNLDQDKQEKTDKYKYKP